MTIGTVANRAGVGVETVRFYERKGLIEEPPRRGSGYREFPPDTVLQVRFIRRQGTRILTRRDQGTFDLAPRAGCNVRAGKGRAESKIRNIEERIRGLQRMKRALEKLAAACGGTGSVSECPILDALEGQEDDGGIIYGRDCPNVRKARVNLIKAFAEAGSEARWAEWRCDDEESPSQAKGYGSPTILVNGKDVMGTEAGAERPPCRLYRNEAGGFDDAPTVRQIAAALRGGGAQVQARRATAGWNSSLASAPGIAVALLPKLICPACWPAYAGLLSAIGLGFLVDPAYLFAVTLTFLLLAVGSLAFRTRKRGDCDLAGRG